MENTKIVKKKGKLYIITIAPMKVINVTIKSRSRQNKTKQ